MGVVEASSGPFWACVDVAFDDEGNSRYSNLIVRHQGKVVLGLANNGEITEYLVSSVNLHIAIMKEETND